jgi:ferritin-like metal-binding protein YciE
MKITNFKDMYIAELQEMVSMEGQLADELPRMAEVASHLSLKHVLTHHREETQIRSNDSNQSCKSMVRTQKRISTKPCRRL